MKIQAFSVLKDSQIRVLIGAQVLSDSGAWLDFTALGILLVYNWGVGATSMAAYFILIGFSYFMGSLFSGALVDSFETKKIMLIGNLLRALAVISYIFVHAQTQLFLIVFIKNFLGAFYDPATQAKIRYIVPEDQLIDANSISNMVSQLIRIFGPLLSGGLLVFFSIDQVFIFCALCFVCSSVVLFFLKKEGKQRSARFGGAAFAKDFIQGLSYIFSRRELISAIIMFAAIIFSIFLSEGFYIILFHQLGLEKSSSGIIYCLGGVGGVAGALILSQYLRDISPLILVACGSILAGVIISLLGCIALHKIAFSWTTFSFLFIILGVANAMLVIPFFTFKCGELISPLSFFNTF